MQRLTAIVSGRVQRCFRMRAWRFGLTFGLHGYVKNLPDGTVQVVAEGEETILEKFADALMVKERVIEVSKIEKQYSPATGELDFF